MKLSQIVVLAIVASFLVIFLTIVWDNSVEINAKKQEVCGQKVAILIPRMNWKYDRNLGCLIEVNKGVWVELTHVYIDDNIYLEESNGPR